MIFIIFVQFYTLLQVLQNIDATCLLASNSCPNEYIDYYFSSKQYQFVKINPMSDEQLGKLIEEPNLPTVIVIPGFATQGMSSLSPGPEIQTALQSKGAHNIIIMNWYALSVMPCYLQATYNAVIVGNCTAQLLDRLVSKIGIKLSNLHIIGHSLGAHIAGYVSANLKSPGKINRIIGLDPAYPMFGLPVSWYRTLNKNDADFVEIIHTQGGIVGQPYPIGTVDFYMNGGCFQPNCQLDLACSHNMAVNYFVESITSTTGFYGIRCIFNGDYRKCREASPERYIMGYDTPQNNSGIFYIRTRLTYPYALGLDR